MCSVDEFDVIVGMQWMYWSDLVCITVSVELFVSDSNSFINFFSEKCSCLKYSIIISFGILRLLGSNMIEVSPASVLNMVRIELTDS
jgi:hypothetical protein